LLCAIVLILITGGANKKLNNVVFAIIPDSSVRVHRLRDGECNLIRSPAPNEAGGLRAAKGG